MELYRKTWTWNQWRTSPYILNDFANWGFVTASDGSEIDVSNLESWAGYTNAKTLGMNIKWKYDKLASSTKNTFTIGIKQQGDGGWSWGYSRGVLIGIRLNYINAPQGSGFNLMLREDGYYNQYADVGITTSYNTKVFFIPLINNGFILNTRLNGNGNQENADPDGANYAGQTPTLKTIYWNPGNSTSEGANKTVIALPPSEKIDALGYTYITQLDYNGYSGGNTYRYIWTDPNNVASMQYLESISSIGYDSHTNVTQDVCTLIRYPYQNSYLDNLYIMTTMPKQFDNDTAYFTIQGRNFMKVFNNIVVELPTS